MFTNKNDDILYLNDRINVCVDVLNRNTKVRNSLNKRLDSFKEKECPHNIIDDYIDIDTSKGMNIRYCDSCFKTF